MIPDAAPATDTQFNPSHISTRLSVVLNLTWPVSVNSSGGRSPLSPTGSTTPYVPANLTYPFAVLLKFVILLFTVFVILLFLNAKLSNVTAPVPLALSDKFVLSAVVVITFPSNRILSTFNCGTLKLVESIVAIVLLSTINLIVLSFAPSVSSAVTLVVPSTSSTPLRLIQLVPL